MSYKKFVWIYTFILFNFYIYSLDGRRIPSSKNKDTPSSESSPHGLIGGRDNLSEEFDPTKCIGPSCKQSAPTIRIRVNKQKTVELEEPKTEVEERKDTVNKYRRDSTDKKNKQLSSSQLPQISQINIRTKATSVDNNAAAESIKHGKEKDKKSRRKSRERKRKNGKKKKNKKTKEEKKKSKDQHEEMVASPPKQEGDISIPQPQKDEIHWLTKLEQLPGAARIEQRLHPTIQGSVRQLLGSMERVLGIVQRKLTTVDSEYMYVFNSTRYDMMMYIRHELEYVAKENENVYDSVLDASLLTKDVYRRAHEQRLLAPRPASAPYRSHVAPPEMLRLDLTQDMNKVRTALRHAEDTKRKVKIRERDHTYLKSKLTYLRNIVDNLPVSALEGLTRLSNQALRALQQAAPRQLHHTRHKIHRYRSKFENQMKQFRQARNFTSSAKEALKQAKKRTMMNQDIRDKVMARQFAGMLSDEPFGSSGLTAWVLVDSAKLHAENLEITALHINRTIGPLVAKAKAAAESQGGDYVARYLRNRVTELVEDVLLAHRLIDQIRLKLGDKDVLRERCEDLEEGSGIWFDDESPIDCEPYLPEPTEGPLVEPTEGPLVEPTEGSGIILEGSGDIDGEGPDVVINPVVAATTTSSPTTTVKVEEEKTDDDDDFSFTDWFGMLSDDPVVTVDKDHKTDRKPEFNELLLKRLQNLSVESDEVYETAKKTHDTVTAAAKQFDDYKDRIATIASNNSRALVFTRTWNAEKTSFNAIQEHVQSVLKDVDIKYDVTNQTCKRAIKTAEKKLKKMEKSKSQRITSAADAESATAAKEAKDSVNLVVENAREIWDLRRIIPSPCVQANEIQTRIRSNITELRHKIEKAKIIAASIQAAVSMNGRNYLKVPVSDDVSTQYPASKVEMMIKPSDVNGPVAVVQTNKTASYVVSLTDQVPTLHVLNEDKDDLGEVMSDSALSDDSWYKITLERSANFLSMLVQNMSDNMPVSYSNITVTDWSMQRSHPTSLFLGGAPDGYPTYGEGAWKGCIADVSVNGRYISLLSNDSGGNAPTLCSSQNPTDSSSSFVLGGSGYVRFPLRVLGSHQVDATIVFSTHSTDGVLLFIKSVLQRYEASVFLKGGRIMVEFRSFSQRGTTLRQSNKDIYSNGIPHSIQVVIQQNRIQVEVGSNEDSFSPVSSRQERSTTFDDGIYIGGLPSKNSADSRSISGCIRKLKMNSYDVPLSLMADGADVYYGRCGSDIWSSCVAFDDNSSPIQFEETSTGDSVHVIFTDGSLGPVLQLTRKEKFSLTVTLDADGIDITETVKDLEERIEFSGSSSGFRVVSVTDNEGSIEVRMGTETKKLCYESGFWGQCKATGDAPYQLKIGGSEDNDVEFNGQVLNVVSDSSILDLSSYVEDHKLQSCAIPAKHKEQEEEMEAKLEC